MWEGGKQSIWTLSSRLDNVTDGTSVEEVLGENNS